MQDKKAFAIFQDPFGDPVVVDVFSIEGIAILGSDATTAVITGQSGRTYSVKPEKPAPGEENPVEYVLRVLRQTIEKARPARALDISVDPS